MNMMHEEYGYCEYDEDFAVTTANRKTYKTDEQMSSGDILAEEFSGTIGSYAAGDVRHGLKIVAAPTGTGKTYGLAKAIAETISTIKDSKNIERVVYITPLRKNIEGFKNELQKQFRDLGIEKEFDDNVLDIPSNTEGVEKGIDDSEVTNFFEEIKTVKELSELCKRHSELSNTIEVCRNLRTAISENKKYDLISSAEQEFRRELKRQLDKEVQIGRAHV